MTNDTKLTNEQLTEMKDSFVEIMVDGMDTKTLARYVYDSMSEYYEKMNEKDFKEEMDNYDECLYDELMENALIEDEEEKEEHFSEILFDREVGGAIDD